MPFDPDTLADTCGNDTELMQSLVQAFLGDYPRQINLLQRVLIERDIDRLCSVAHSIKGAVLPFGATRAAAAALGVEACCRRGDLAAVGPRGDELLRALAELADSLRAGYAAG